MTQEELKRLLSYDPETGVFIRRIARKGWRAGTVAGCLRPDGYLSVCLNYRDYLLHRLAWLYMTGRMPDELIDHINGDKSDNRFCNLRESSYSGNMHNSKKPKHNTSGEKGVSRKGDGWLVQIHVRRQRVAMFFDDFSDAAAWARQKRIELHGEFARHA